MRVVIDTSVVFHLFSRSLGLKAFYLVEEHEEFFNLLEVSP